ncbi:hypothetical protein FZEAL_8521 [Fusarium zealandicum]|uniref:Glucuronyl hydrolase n=1 Tax=Fusarium zealandicum TaxID=1053134 RepID=A0A8H4UEN9_9HYPO|nr:hypothetical protein FZEAL_8521 [Fusarium zealandicum]
MGSIDPLPVELIDRKQTIQCRLSELFDENITAKILRTAVEQLEGNVSSTTKPLDKCSHTQNPPFKYPEVVPQDGQERGHYRCRNIDFWTCGFFPGCIYSLIRRCVEYPNSIKSSAGLVALRTRLEALGRTWSDPIHHESRLTNTHDMGFIMLPHMRPRWELFHDYRALESIVTSARNLASRFSPKVGAIRSWDQDIWSLVTSGRGKPGSYIVIIDSMCNLDLLFYAAAQTDNPVLAHIAERHARTLLRSHLRPEYNMKRDGFDGVLYSSGHVVNFSSTGEIDERLTAQGYSATSTWSRGQAWAILGYAQTYTWTKKAEFLDAACGLAEYFLLKMETAPACVEIDVQNPDGSVRKAGRYVPMWDFSAPPDEFSPPLRDSSAGVCAANGLLILSQALAPHNSSLSARYLEAALTIVDDTLAYSLSQDKARIVTGQDGQLIGVDSVAGKTFESILLNATVSNNKAGIKQIRDHGLVYADYYLLEFGNRLLRMGLV